MQDLPEELVQEIFSHLDYYELLRSNQWSKKFQAIASQYSTSSSVPWMTSIHRNTDKYFSYNCDFILFEKKTFFSIDDQYTKIVYFENLSNYFMDGQIDDFAKYVKVRNGTFNYFVYTTPHVFVEREYAYRLIFNHRDVTRNPQYRPISNRYRQRCICGNPKAKFCLGGKCAKDCTDTKCKGHIGKANAVGSKGKNKREAEDVFRSSQVIVC